MVLDWGGRGRQCMCGCICKLCWGSPASARSEVRKRRSPHGGARGSAVRGAGRVTAGTWQSTGGWRVRETLAVEGVCGTGTCRPQMQRELIGQWSSFALLWPSVLLPFRFELSQRTRPSPSRHLIQATQRGLTLRPKEVASSNALRGCCTTAYLGLPRRAAAPNPGSASAVQTAPGRRPVTGHGSALACLDELCHPRPQRRANELQAGCVKGCGSCEETAAPAGAADAEDR